MNTGGRTPKNRQVRMALIALKAVEQPCMPTPTWVEGHHVVAPGFAVSVSGAGHARWRDQRAKGLPAIRDAAAALEAAVAEAIFFSLPRFPDFCFFLYQQNLATQRWWNS